MRNPMDIDDFESFLQDEVNQHRMYPSDHVWRNIQQDLHGYKKWPALTVITLFVISALVAGTLLIKPSIQPLVSYPALAAKNAGGPVVKGVDTNENLQQKLSPEHITQQTISAVTADWDIEGSIQNAFSPYHAFPDMTAATIATDAIADISPVQIADVAGSTSPTATTGHGQLTTPVNEAKANLAVLAGVSHQDAGSGVKKSVPFWDKRMLGFNWMKANDVDAQNPDRFYYTKGVWKAVYDGKVLYSFADRLPTPKNINFNPIYNVEPKPAGKQTSSVYTSKLKTGGRFNVQAYITPAVSYRILARSGSKSNTYLPGPTSSSVGYLVDVNTLARKKPAPGYEAGVAFGYKLNNRFTLKAGLQFNVREYDIQGSAVSHLSATPTNPASNGGIANGLDLSQQTAQSIVSTKELPNVILTNMYYQIAAPVGVDWKAWGHHHFAWNIAASVQPTYILNKDPFIITSADKSYAEGSALLRKWNLNSNLETYFSYSTGKYTWQIGPQIRYQLLSTLKTNYPVAEHVVDYGIKVGFVRSLP